MPRHTLHSCGIGYGRSELVCLAARTLHHVSGSGSDIAHTIVPYQAEDSAGIYNACQATAADSIPAHRSYHHPAVDIPATILLYDSLCVAYHTDSNAHLKHHQQALGGIYRSLVLQRRKTYPAFDAPPEDYRHNGQLRQDINETLSISYTL